MNKKLTGKITFIHHEKNYASIEYLLNGKTKSINGSIDENRQLKSKENKPAKKKHPFRIGDEVSFVLLPSAKGDRMIAGNIEFLFNNAYSNLLNKAKTDNRFAGYLKKADGSFFVKETGSYILFPLVLSPWEKEPHENSLNEPVFFRLDNIDKTNGITASLIKKDFIPEYAAAMQHYENKTPVEAKVYKVTPHGIFIRLLNDKIEAKLSADKNAPVAAEQKNKPGDSISVMITYMGPMKIVVEKF